jgi:type I restriction enzyme S subunit
MASLNQDIVGRIEIPLAPISHQRKIVEVLSAYDELIENNSRRIEILEEMAQAIYREWFVEFRYPGHKGVPLVHSELGPIPEGWAARSLQDVIELAYGKALKSGDRRGGPVPVFGSGGVVGSHDVPLVNGPGIVVGRKGNVGSVHWSDDSFFPIDTTFYVKTDLPMAYAYYMLCDAEFIDSHAAVPGLSREQAYGLNCLVPDRQVVEKFGVVVGQIFALRKVLEESNRNLLETRDLLLPRLVSGEIDVSELDIPDEQDSPA